MKRRVRMSELDPDTRSLVVALLELQRVTTETPAPRTSKAAAKPRL